MDSLKGDVGTGGTTAGDAIADVLKSHLSTDNWQWLSTHGKNLAADPKPGMVARLFTSLPRQLKSDGTPPTVSINDALQGPGGLSLAVHEWSVVRLARVWVLTCIPKLNEAEYMQLIEQLFKYGDMEELTALYSALPVYHYSKAWQARCKEGIRSNIGPVRHAVMVNNPYPARFLDEDAWNQLVLKAFFTEETIPNIIGLSQRNNLRLAQALTDYAYERYAAKREIDPMLWILVGPFIDDRAFELMKRIVVESPAPLERKAIAYAFGHSGYNSARSYIMQHDQFNTLSDHSGTPWEAWEQ